MLWQYCEKELEKFLKFLNCYHPTIKFTANYSRKDINFLEVSVRKKNNQLDTDLYIKPKDTHQYLRASSCHVYHSKKSILNSQVLRLNRICSENSFYDKCCNELEIWLRERGYSDKLVRQQIFKARNRKRKDILNNIKDYKLVLNITYHPNFSNLKDIVSLLHLLLTPDQEHQHVFHQVPIISFRRAKSFKDILVRAKVPPVQKNEGFCGPCQKSRYDICEHIVINDSFKSITTQKTYFIRPPDLKFSAKNVVYLFTRKTCSKECTGSTENFRSWFNNYRRARRNFLKRKKVEQESFNPHFTEANHNGEEDWEVRLIDQANNLEDLRKSESFQQHGLETFQPNGLNEREVALFLIFTSVLFL